MVKLYCVAGHCFSIEFPNGVFPDRFSNYEPFEIEFNSSSPIFNLSVSYSGIARPDELESVFVQRVPGESRLDLYSNQNIWFVEMSPLSDMDTVASLCIDKDFKNGSLYVSAKEYIRFAVDNAAMFMFAFSTSKLDTLEMHSSVIVHDGKAYMFLAKSGTGKSTHSRMWIQNIPDTFLLNDDNPAVRIMKDGQVMVFGTPWSGKTPCYRNMSFPLGAMVRISRSKSNSISRLSVLEAYALISSSASGARFIDKIADGLHDTISRIAIEQASFVLNCRPDPEAAETCYNAVCNI